MVMMIFNIFVIVLLSNCAPVGWSTPLVGHKEISDREKLTILLDYAATTDSQESLRSLLKLNVLPKNLYRRQIIIDLIE
jgi:hypothetical protein